MNRFIQPTALLKLEHEKHPFPLDKFIWMYNLSNRMSISDLRPRMGGPIPKFKEYHIWKAMWCLSRESPLGRKSLSARLNIGEGSTRTILTILQDAGIVSIRKNGISLSPEGRVTWAEIMMDVHPMEDDDITIGKANCAVRVPRAGVRVNMGCEERDAAIKAGAIGATTLLYSNGVLMFPGNEYPVNPKTQRTLQNMFDLRNDDAIIIGTAETVEMAEEGAVTAALELIGGLRLNRDKPEAVATMGTNELIAFAFMVHDLVGGLPTCAKPRDSLGVRIENGRVVDNAYTGAVMEEVLEVGTTIRRIAVSGPYKGIRVIVSPLEIDNKVVASIGVVDIRTMAGINNPIRLQEDDEY